MNRFLFFFFLFFLFTNLVFAQKKSSPPPQPIIKTKSSGIEMIARVSSNSVLLRWAPTTPQAWQYGNKYGYKIERFTLAQGSKFTLTHPEKKIITNDIIKPLPLDKWEAMAKNNKYAAIAAQAIYGESFSIKEAKQNAMTMINKSQELENRYSFSLFAADQSLPVAYAMGLGFTDLTAQAGEKYLYKIYISTPTSTIKIDTGMLYVNTSELYSVPMPTGLKVNFGDQIAALHWNSFYFENSFSSYIIERAEKGKPFIQLNSEPIIRLTSSSQSSDEIIFTDSLPSNEVTYTYRIKGITPFGEISSPSNEITGQGKKSSPDQAPIILKQEIRDKNKIAITWDFLKEDEKTINEFHIERASKAKGPYQVIVKEISSSVRTWTDEFPLSTNYYIVKAIGLDGNQKASLPSLVQLEDTISPLPPIDLTGTIDSLGIVRLVWKKNTEKDVSGYRVFVANDPKAIFAQITPGQIFVNQLIDTISTDLLNEKIYYKIVAVDKHFNTSDFSKIVELKRPDHTPPVAPIIDEIKVLQEGIYLHWQWSSSEDVAKHELYRKEAKEKQWKLIRTFYTSSLKNEYIDSIKKENKEYEYKMIAIDKSNLNSTSPYTVKASSFTEPTDQIKELNISIDRKNKCIVLNWKLNASAEEILIYRSNDGNPFTVRKLVDGKTNEWKDEQVTLATTYSYFIQAILIDGSKSKISEQVKTVY